MVEDVRAPAGFEGGGSNFIVCRSDSRGRTVTKETGAPLWKHEAKEFGKNLRLRLPANRV
jgi:hypothetical protein